MFLDNDVLTGSYESCDSLQALRRMDHEDIKKSTKKTFLKEVWKNFLLLEGLLMC
jgi:hypothetical protein